MTFSGLLRPSQARNVRDRTRMEEMAKAKTRAEEERDAYRLMLEQAHERLHALDLRERDSYVHLSRKGVTDIKGRELESH